MSRLRSVEPVDRDSHGDPIDYSEPMAGELAGRWYWDALEHRFRRSRRSGRDRRRAVNLERDDPPVVDFPKTLAQAKASFRDPMIGVAVDVDPEAIPR